MSNEIQKVNNNLMFTNPTAFEFAMRVAKVFSESDMVPEQFQKSVGNCLIAMNFANRIGADIFMVMQNMHVIHKKPGIEGKLVIALVNQCGRFEPLQFEEGTDFCLAYAQDLKSGKILQGTTITLKMVKAEGWYDKKGSKWKTMPDQMYRYRAATFFARTYCPEVLLGMQTKEELIDVGPIDVTPTEAKAKELTDKLKPTPEKIDAMVDFVSGKTPKEKKKESKYEYNDKENKEPVTERPTFKEDLHFYRNILGDEAVNTVAGNHDLDTLKPHEQDAMLSVLKAQADLEAAKEETK